MTNVAFSRKKRNFVVVVFDFRIFESYNKKTANQNDADRKPYTPTLPRGG